MTETEIVAPEAPHKLSEEERTSIRHRWDERTFKREIAVLGLTFWLLLSVIATLRFLIVPPADVVMLTAMGTAFSSIYTIATTMIFVFAGAAFGIDAYAKQIK